jgi:hypothetical protein
MFDSVLLLGAGRAVFMGATRDAMRYFQQVSLHAHTGVLAH